MLFNLPHLFAKSHPLASASRNSQLLHCGGGQAAGDAGGCRRRLLYVTWHLPGLMCCELFCWHRCFLPPRKKKKKRTQPWVTSGNKDFFYHLNAVFADGYFCKILALLQALHQESTPCEMNWWADFAWETLMEVKSCPASTMILDGNLYR